LNERGCVRCTYNKLNPCVLTGSDSAYGYLKLRFLRPQLRFLGLLVGNILAADLIVSETPLPHFFATHTQLSGQAFLKGLLFFSGKYIQEEIRQYDPLKVDSNEKIRGVGKKTVI
jgi:hypothetical protein